MTCWAHGSRSMCRPRELYGRGGASRGVRVGAAERGHPQRAAYAAGDAAAGDLSGSGAMRSVRVRVRVKVKVRVRLRFRVRVSWMMLRRQRSATGKSTVR